ncbi:DUF7266 family protein [Salinilacihabitans rarus]|uniref:DUF7266 family protein n=1 Tax=Salinilacihabitans rarus TaxID=2961596 RepID=UPI0020C8B53A|nr:hypothetical protein [Salinilacihabitans rarus]
MIRRLDADERAVSITVTHVLTIGITTILVAGLLVGAGTMLDSERERSTERSLEIVGERLAGELSHADRLAESGDQVTITADHPRRAGNAQYTVELRDSSDCDAPLVADGQNCLRLATIDNETETYVPVSVDVGSDSEKVQGGTVIVRSDGDDVELLEEP